MKEQTIYGVKGRKRNEGIKKRKINNGADGGSKNRTKETGQGEKR